MKKSALFTLVLLCLLGTLNAQTFTPNETYNYTRVFLDSVTVGSSNYGSAQSRQSVQYTDGLGRPKQDISINPIKPGQDIVTSYFYEPNGVQTKQYMPVSVASQGGMLHTISEANINSYYGVPNAYSEVAYDDSPMNRVIKSASAGSDWSMTSGNTKEYFYEFNEATTVKKYASVLDVNNFTNSLDDLGFYAVNTLYKNSVKDEDGNISEVYKNGMGQTIMSRVKNGPVNLDTYYVYNQYNQLAYTIPPLNPGEIATDINVKEKILYQYQYDAYGRLTEKKLPGKSKEFYVYDKEDRVIMSTDEKLKAQGKWSFIKYDRQGRTIYTGLCTGGERTAVQSAADVTAVIFENRTLPTSPGFTSVGFNVYYTKNAYPTAVTEVLSINYYDEYPAGIAVTKPTDISTQPTLSSNIADSHSTKSLLTASLVKNIGNTGWNKTLFWYDTKERLIGNHKLNYQTGVTRTEMKLDFPGNITESKVYHKRTEGMTEVLVKQRYVYSAQNLLVKHYHQVNTRPEELLEELTYDDLGRITNKKTGNNLQSIDYSYNVRGWLTAVNDQNNLGTDLFAFKINFNQRDGVETPNNDFAHLQVKPKYNGSIAETSWVTTANYTHRYGYVYDNSGQLLAGLYQYPNNPYQKDNSEVATYDNRGNMKTLFRTAYKPLKGGVRLIDNLDYNTYDGNRISRINDLSGNESGYEGGNGLIQYDINGNITAMPDKGITNISYNFLNLPETIANKNLTKFLYSADGTKLKKTVKVDSNGTLVNITTEYLDGFQYSTPNTVAINRIFEEPLAESGAEIAKTAAEPEAFFMAEKVVEPSDGENLMELVFFPTSEGFYDYQNERYIYQYKDHLGNVRVNYTKMSDGSAVALDYNNYYAFGMNLLNSMSVSQYDPLGAPYNYKYNGKELQETGNYDFGARQYMPDIGRWSVIDPLAEQYRRHSPYNYAVNNPIRFIDPDGRGIASTGVRENKDGTYTVVSAKDDGNNGIYRADDKGNYDVETSDHIANSLTPRSFMGDDNKAVVGAVISFGDLSGNDFLNDLMGPNEPNIINYMKNGVGGAKYDFKTNGPNGEVNGIQEIPKEERAAYTYRGVLFSVDTGDKADNVAVVASARDVGNFAAGYIAGNNGLTWGTGRLGFDALQSWQQGGLATEGQTTQQAQKVGHTLGHKNYNNRRAAVYKSQSSNPLRGPK